MEFTFLYITLGLLGLWLGTKWIINGAMGMAKKFRWSHSFVGIAILAVGTDLPEVFVTIKAALNNTRGIESSGIITGNAIGSSISQITFILGLGGLFLTFKMEDRDIWRDGIALTLSMFLFYIFGKDGLISTWEGASMVLVYVAYYIVLIKGQDKKSEESYENVQSSGYARAGYLSAGFVLLISSSHLVVENAMQIANQWGLAQSLVGIVIVGLGTSLPELAVSVGAAFRKSAGMSVGNVIGSNIFDGLIPIGLGGMISQIKTESSMLAFDLPYLFISSLLVLLFLRSKRGISTVEGILLICIFILYLAIKIHLPPA